MLEHGSSAAAYGEASLAETVPPPRSEAANPAPRLRIGLLNNMPDTALVQTERQFRRLIGTEVDLSFFSLASVPRGPLARAHLDRFYAPHTALAAAGLDALVITGSEPKAARLDEEPYYADFTEVVDWAAQGTVSTLFSCLAAHAAVLHLDRIERRPMATKYSGVYACAASGVHPLLAGMAPVMPVPHSRWNDLPEFELAAKGYTVLRRSEDIGVDLFVREGASLMVFLQGHPEYETDTLAREYRRDIGRFLDGSRDTCPALPENYYTDDAAERLEAFAALAQAERAPALHADFPAMDATPPRPAAWQDGAARLFRNWLALVAANRALRMAVA
ncbi:homoserine O-succinyltransferase [Methylorubrum rhodinum]|uniref:Homoserine O-succinyltransferase n=1 Tax=Methylorubrum rhodinum TaxID=29428 RepID=A0A840ZLN7_9HYPH|nr:homoserine O-succinyltransferase [Methylorubrum rhodinum]MBB5757851.1 homoserine O-succinyltransferase [Methylorubrum rhodinum]